MLWTLSWIAHPLDSCPWWGRTCAEWAGCWAPLEVSSSTLFISFVFVHFIVRPQATQKCRFVAIEFDSRPHWTSHHIPQETICPRGCHAFAYWMIENDSSPLTEKMPYLNSQPMPSFFAATRESYLHAKLGEFSNLKLGSLASWISCDSPLIWSLSLISAACFFAAFLTALLRLEYSHSCCLGKHSLESSLARSWERPRWQLAFSPFY
jgi:hypothetical protein